MVAKAGGILFLEKEIKSHHGSLAFLNAGSLVDVT